MDSIWKRSNIIITNRPDLHNISFGKHIQSPFLAEFLTHSDTHVKRLSIHVSDTSLHKECFLIINDKAYTIKIDLMSCMEIVALHCNHLETLDVTTTEKCLKDNIGKIINASKALKTLNLTCPSNITPEELISVNLPNLSKVSKNVVLEGVYSGKIIVDVRRNSQ